MKQNDSQAYDVQLDAQSGTPACSRSRWFQEARFGMFVHWGLYSELGGSWGGRTMPDPSLPNGNSWYSEWIQMRLEVPADEYQALAKTFNPIKLDMDQWVREAALAGARYIVLTSKHHDGFALWDSDVSDFDLSVTPCKRDILGELATACRRHGVRLGFYYSHWQDWEHPGGAMPPWPEMGQPTDDEFEAYWQQKSLPQVRELLERYEPDMLWFDTWGNTAEGQITPPRRDEMIDLIRGLRPSCLINGRLCAHDPGDRVDYLSAGDNQHPERNLGRPWQTPATMNHTWAWHARDFNWKSSGKLIQLLAANASYGGNYLLNIGPRADGTIPAPSIRRLREIGAWLAVHGEAIYGATPLDGVPKPDWGYLTGRGENGRQIVYAHVVDWQNGTLSLPAELCPIAHGSVLETGETLVVLDDQRSFRRPEGGLHPAVAVMELTLHGC